jgi:hypothetical protein
MQPAPDNVRHLLPLKFGQAFDLAIFVSLHSALNSRGKRGQSVARSQGSGREWRRTATQKFAPYASSVSVSKVTNGTHQRHNPLFLVSKWETPQKAKNTNFNPDVNFNTA